MTKKIPWTEETWNPVVGCTKCSPGCLNCYALDMAWRLVHIEKTREKHRGISFMRLWPNTGLEWTNKIKCLENELDKPLHWRKPRKIFVCSMSDLFHPKVPFEFIDKVIDVFNKCPQHTGQILTKRAERMYEYSCSRYCMWPENIIGMVTAENQAMTDLRIPFLLRCGFKTTGVSIEPMLGPIDLRCIIVGKRRRGLYDCLRGCGVSENRVMPDPTSGHLDWVIVGGESGPNARLMHPYWARGIRDQCQAAGIPFFFKQWGEWLWNENDSEENGFWKSVRVGKKKAGCQLDGREHKEYPVKT